HSTAQVALTIFLFHFLSRLRLRPAPTLFPYTTLFRSPPGIAGDLCRRHPPCRSPTGPRRGCAAAARAEPRATSREGVNVARRRQDRKSTRLNSSHVAISYAVFCLKKKNKRTRRSLEWW